MAHKRAAPSCSPRRPQRVRRVAGAISAKPSERRACGTARGEWRDSAKWCLGYFYHFKAEIGTFTVLAEVYCAQCSFTVLAETVRTFTLPPPYAYRTAYTRLTLRLSVYYTQSPRGVLEAFEHFPALMQNLTGWHMPTPPTPLALRFHYALTKDRVCIVDHMLHW